MTRIAITGASGKLGSATLDFLLARGFPAGDIVAVGRDPAKTAAFATRGVDVRHGDYLDVRSLEHAFRDVERLLFISTSALGDERMHQHRNVVSAAHAAQVGHIFYTSVVKPAPHAIFAASPGHFHTEALIRESGIAHTFFRNNLYLDLVPLMFGSAVTTGKLAHNAADGRIGFVSRQDIAEALAVALSMNPVAQVHDITAITPYGLADVAAALGKASGKQITYEPLSSEEFRGLLEGLGLPAPVVGMSVALGEAMRAGEFDVGSRDLERLLGRAPTTLQDFLAKALAAK